MIWGPHIERLGKRRKVGKDSPAARKALDDQPEIEQRLAWIWDAFWSLSGGRTYGGGMTPVANGIPFTEIEAYAARVGITGWEEFHRFERIIRTLDSVYRDETARRQKKSSSSTGNRKKSRT